MADKVVGKEEKAKKPKKAEKTEEKVEEKKEAKTGEKVEGKTAGVASVEEKKVEVAAVPEEEKKEPVKEAKEDRAAIVYIYSSPNNTMIHVTDLAGSTLAKVTGGMVTKHSRLKADPTIAMFAAKRASERIKDFGVTSLYIRTKAKTGSPGIGPGAHAAVKTLSKEGFKIVNILDTTSVPRGGPKKKGGRRGRRV